MVLLQVHGVWHAARRRAGSSLCVPITYHLLSWRSEHSQTGPHTLQSIWFPNQIQRWVITMLCVVQCTMSEIHHDCWCYCLHSLRCKGDMFSGTKCIVSVLCTAPNKYTVVDPEGSIRPKFCVDIVVRHSAISPANCNITDKFRIHLQNHTTKQVWFLT